MGAGAWFLDCTEQWSNAPKMTEPRSTRLSAQDRDSAFVEAQELWIKMNKSEAEKSGSRLVFSRPYLVYKEPLF